jgi:hypothetical protein
VEAVPLPARRIGPVPSAPAGSCAAGTAGRACALPGHGSAGPRLCVGLACPVRERPFALARAGVQSRCGPVRRLAVPAHCRNRRSPAGRRATRPRLDCDRGCPPGGRRAAFRQPPGRDRPRLRHGRRRVVIRVRLALLSYSGAGWHSTGPSALSTRRTRPRWRPCSKRSGCVMPHNA